MAAGERFDERHDLANREPARARAAQRRANRRRRIPARGTRSVLESGRNRRGNVRMIDIRRRRASSRLGHERRGLFGSQVETKDFDCDEPIARSLIIRGLVRTEDRTQRARTNLMENPERPECFRRKVQDRIFAVQRSNGNMNSLHIPVDIRRFPWVKKLAADYAFQFSALAPFFSGDPAAPASWAAAIANAQRHPRRRAELSALLAKQLERRNAPAAAREAAARLADPKRSRSSQVSRQDCSAARCSRSIRD